MCFKQLRFSGENGPIDVMITRYDPDAVCVTADSTSQSLEPDRRLRILGVMARKRYIARDQDPVNPAELFCQCGRVGIHYVSYVGVEVVGAT